MRRAATHVALAMHVPIARAVALAVASCMLASCNGDADRAEKNRQQLAADEEACKGELAEHDQWSTTTLSERCQRIANMHDQQRQLAKAEEARKAQQAIDHANDLLDQQAGATCDAKARARREKWLHTGVRDGDRTTSPSDEGLQLDGRCSQKLVERAPDCSDSAIWNVNHDSPWIPEAAHVGFTRLVCKELDRVTKEEGVVFRRQVEKPIDWLLASTKR